MVAGVLCAARDWLGHHVSCSVRRSSARLVQMLLGQISLLWLTGVVGVSCVGRLNFDCVSSSATALVDEGGWVYAS